MKKATMLTLAPLAAATALAGCASTGSYGYDDGGYGYYDNSYHDRYGRYDWNNPDPRYGGYYADNYYRNDRRYRERRLSDGDRISRGRDGKYYCRRSDGTTGLIVGGIAGGVLGNVIAPGDSKTLGTVIGAIGGAVAGNAIDRGSKKDDVRCR
jgi:outer membrane lipoprotein SlyB